MRVLLTNDDGVYAPGLLALKQAVQSLGEIFVVAPERPRSAAGHSITLHKPLRIQQVTLSDGSTAFASNGTPADCVTVGSMAVMDNRVDVVISGINHGPNLGWDVHYSGTVAAAKEAAMTGHMAIAVSVASYDQEVHWGPAADFAARVAHSLIETPLPPRTLLNINAPNLPAEQICGVRVTEQGPRQYVDRVERRTDPSGRDYFWLGGRVSDDLVSEATDVHAVSQNMISLTPLQLDLTERSLLSDLRRSWDT